MLMISLLFLDLFSQDMRACGDHNNELLRSGSPLIHQSYENFDKQFPDSRTVYDINNPNHRGMSPWRSTTLNGSRTLALTYDDGPHPKNTPRLLDILKKYNVKATFFVLGELAERYPKIIKRMVNENHIVASHDWFHDNSNNESETEFKGELKRSIREVRKHQPGPFTYYRFPYGAYAHGNGYHHLNALREVSMELFTENCINFAFWDIDTSDWVSEMTPANISQTLWANIRGGSAWRFKSVRRNGRLQYIKVPYSITEPARGGVVLMHDIHKRTVEATNLFLQEATTSNIQFVTLKEVAEFEYQNQQCSLLNAVAKK